MKVCPKCNKTYNDEFLNFCLEDGELLLEQQTVDATPTIMFDSPRQTNDNWSNIDTSFADQNQPIQQNQQMYQPPFASPQNYAMSASKDQTMPIVSLITGILGITLCVCYMGFIFGPVGLITGYIGMNNATKNPDIYGGKSMAQIGMVLGGVSLLMSVLYIILIILGSFND